MLRRSFFILPKEGDEANSGFYIVASRATTCNQSMLLVSPQNPDLSAEACHTRTCDWNGALGSYDASVDWPVAEFLEEFVMEFPDAKVI